MTLRRSHEDRRCRDRGTAGRTSLMTAAVLALGLTGLARAEDLPEAEKVLDRYIKVTGGRSAYENCKTRVTKGTLEVMGMGMKGAVSMFQSGSHKSYMTVEFEGMGKTEEGFDGQVAWEKNAMMGARIKEGPERNLASRSADLLADLNWREHFPQVKTVALEDVDGKPSYKVEMSPKEGAPEYRFYDKETGLLLKATTVLTTHMGEIPVEAFFDDYKEAQGITLPHKLTQKVAMQQVVLTFNEVTHNADIPSERFTLPDDVKALIEAEKKKSEEKVPAAAETPKEDEP